MTTAVPTGASCRRRGSPPRARKSASGYRVRFGCGHHGSRPRSGRRMDTSDRRRTAQTLPLADSCTVARVMRSTSAHRRRSLRPTCRPVRRPNADPSTDGEDPGATPDTARPDICAEPGVDTNVLLSVSPTAALKPTVRWCGRRSRPYVDAARHGAVEPNWRRSPTAGPVDRIAVASGIDPFPWDCHAVHPTVSRDGPASPTTRPTTQPPTSGDDNQIRRATFVAAHLA